MPTRGRTATVATLERFKHLDGDSAAAIQLREECAHDHEPPRALVTHFLHRSFEAFEPSQHHNRRLIISPMLAGKAIGGNEGAAAIAKVVHSKAAEKMSAINAAVASKYEADDNALWGQRRSFDDEILVVVRSPDNQNNYLAFGARRLYWYNSTKGDLFDDEEDEEDEGEFDDVDEDRPQRLHRKLTSGFAESDGHDAKRSSGQMRQLFSSRLGEVRAAAMSIVARRPSLGATQPRTTASQRRQQLQAGRTQRPAGMQRRPSLTSGGSKAVQGGTLTALSYDRDAREVALAEQAGTPSPPTLADVFFTLNRQGVVLSVPLSGDVLEVQDLPIRFTNDRNAVEGSRLCVVLNALRELLYAPDGQRTAPPEWGALSHIKISRELVLLHLAEARRVRKDHMLLNDDGELPDVFDPVDSPNPAALKHKLGAGLASYLIVLEYGAIGFLVAALAAIPTLRNNERGGVLTSVGFGGIAETYSLGNRPPWEVTFWPTQGLDILYTLVLMCTFTCMRRSASRLAKEVDFGSIDPSDFTVYCSQLPPELGRDESTTSAAMASYRRFFREVCRKPRPPSAPSEAALPPDDEISEIVLVKDDNEWLLLRRELAEAVAAKRVAELKEQKPRPTYPTCCGRRLGEEEQRLVGCVAGYSSAYWRAKIDEISRQLRELETTTLSAGSDGSDVVGAFVTFNSTEAVDKVHYELQPSAVLGKLLPWKPTNNFEYDLALTHDEIEQARPKVETVRDKLVELGMRVRSKTAERIAASPTVQKHMPRLATRAQDTADAAQAAIEEGARPMLGYDRGRESVRHGSISVERAVEPSDYVWENLGVQGWARTRSGCLGWSACILVVLLAISLNSFLSTSLAPPLLSPAQYTLSDQKCGDVEYLRTVPHAARQCGYGYGSMSLTDQMMASVLADAEPAAGFGGGHLGELFAAARCTTRVDGGSFSSYQKWHRLVQPTSRFAVSDGYGKFHAACAFLSNPTEDELGGFYTTDATGATRTMYCGYKANTSALPYRMQAKFKCEAPLFDADHPGGLSSRGGVKDVLLADECDEPNCLLCNQHYLACLDASVEEGRWAARDFSATWAASLHLAEADLRSYGVGVIVGTVTTLLPLLAPHLCALTRPLSRTHEERTTMLMTFLMLFGHSMGSLIAINYTALGKLGFYTSAGQQVYSLLVTYSMIKLLSLWSLPHIKYLYKTRLAWRRNTKTQTELNELFAAEQFSYAYNMAAALFLIFMAVLVSTPLPLALVLTSASLLLRYLTERLYFVRVYAKPPCYNGALIESCLSTLPYAVLGKIVSMAYFYHESQAGGGPAMYATSLLYVTWRFYPSTKGPLGWFAWRSDTDDADQRADLGTTVTHQEMRARGKVATYDPMAQLRSAASQEQLREVEELVVRALKKRGTYSAALIDAALVQLGAEERTRMHPSGAPGRRGAAGAAPAEAVELVLYVSPREVVTAELHKLLGKQLPSHLRPQRIVPLDVIPRGQPRRGHSTRPVVVKALPPPPLVLDASSTTDDGGSGSLLAQRWVNPHVLPLVTMDPNTFELTHPSKDAAEHRAERADDLVDVCQWSRTKRLSGATSYERFGTWQEARRWMEGEWMEGRPPPLRTPHFGPGGLPRPLGVSADGVEAEPPVEGWEAREGGDGRFTYDGCPTMLLPPSRAWHMLSAPPRAKAQPEWVVCYTRDRTDLPCLKWKVIEANSREALQRKLDAYMSVSYDATQYDAAAGYDERSALLGRQDVWVVQSIAAELCTFEEKEHEEHLKALATALARESSQAAAEAENQHAELAPDSPDHRGGLTLDERLRLQLEARVGLNVGAEARALLKPTRASMAQPGRSGHSGMWVRWVAVLRAGGVPPVLNGVPSTSEQLCDFVLEETLPALMHRRLMTGYELTAIGGTPPTANARAIVFSRVLSAWAPYVTRTDPYWPHEWLVEQTRNGYLVSSLAYSAESWTVTMVKGDGDSLNTDDDERARQCVLFRSTLPEARGFERFSRAGYRLSALACGPYITELTDAEPVGTFSEGFLGLAAGARDGAASSGADQLPRPRPPAASGAPASTYVLVFSKCPNGMLPPAHRSKGSLCYHGRMRHLLGPSRCWHRAWTAHEACAAHATSTGDAEAGDIAGCLAACAAPPVDPPPPVVPRAAFVLDGDDGTYWRSGVLTTDPHGRPLPVLLTIDLGLERPIDRVLLYWGAEEVEPMPREAELLLSRREIAPDDERPRVEERVPLQSYKPPPFSARSRSASEADALGPEADADSPTAYVEGVSQSTIEFKRQVSARYLQLRMTLPASGASWYALRNVLAIGPPPSGVIAEADGVARALTEHMLHPPRRPMASSMSQPRPPSMAPAADDGDDDAASAALPPPSQCAPTLDSMGSVSSILEEAGELEDHDAQGGTPAEEGSPSAAPAADAAADAADADEARAAALSVSAHDRRNTAWAASIPIPAGSPTLATLALALPNAALVEKPLELRPLRGEGEAEASAGAKLLSNAVLHTRSGRGTSPRRGRNAPQGKPAGIATAAATRQAVRDPRDLAPK